MESDYTGRGTVSNYVGKTSYNGAVKTFTYGTTPLKSLWTTMPEHTLTPISTVADSLYIPGNIMIGGNIIPVSSTSMASLQDEIETLKTQVSQLSATVASLQSQINGLA